MPTENLPTLPNPFDPQAGDTRQRLLSAAARVFAAQGYARATTRAIAAEAGLTEVTLFRRFGSKEKLFAAVVEQFGAQPIREALRARLSGDLRQDLLLFGSLMLKLILERIDAVRLMLGEAAHFPEVRKAVAQNPRQLRQALAEYLEEQMRAGKLRQAHPEAAAQAFLGVFFAYAISQGILGEVVRPEISNQEFVAQVVEIFLGGIGIHEVNAGA
ncbi:MAG: TetR/AcrR family transcriptional regulator [Anaerolineales bacterium]|nr:TetR/AcrR family transcriptional regulator [Anaerolineales bacterium]